MEGGATATAAAVAAEETALCLTANSDVEGFRLEVWLLEARWPGVWLRGIGGIVSAEMSFCASSLEETDVAVVSVDGDVADAIF